MRTADFYRQQVEEALARAGSAHSADARNAWLHIAEHYRALALTAERQEMYKRGNLPKQPADG